MVLYEANFIKLNQLIGGLDTWTGSAVSCSPGDCDLHLTLDSRTKYTCQMRLTYEFPEPAGGVLAEPDLTARVYFDARIVEVTGWSNHNQHELLRRLRRQAVGNVDICWIRNNMLAKWLDYLLEQGHKFNA